MAWYLAANRDKQNVMQKIWEWAKKELRTEEIKNEMLLRTDNTGRTAWHFAACRGEQDVMQKIWDMAKEKLTTEEIKN
jgi:predicted small metal-binding protein